MLVDFDFCDRIGRHVFRKNPVAFLEKVISVDHDLLDLPVSNFDGAIVRHIQSGDLLQQIFHHAFVPFGKGFGIENDGVLFYRHRFIRRHDDLVQFDGFINQDGIFREHFRRIS